jgi:predicted nuclease of restriction endonuclease-like RecB superfamily
MRTLILVNASTKLSIKPDDLEKALWADKEENLIVKNFRTITPKNLLKEYNLSQAQTLLFKATGMEIRFEDNYQQIFRKIKQLGLIYSILDDKIYLDGPISLFKLTEKYGMALAKLLPIIIMSIGWSFKASILKKTPRGNRIYYFTLDHTKKEILSTDSGIEETLRFDSAIEKEFYQLSFNGWTVRREPTILKAGQHAFIPDFSMERNGTKIYVEIIGYWTPEYLKNKIQKLNQLKEKESMLLLINRNLACSGSEIKIDNLVFYDKKIPYLEIIKILRKYEERQLMEDIAKLRGVEISLDSSVGIFSLDEAAKRYGVSLEAVKEIIKGQNKTDYLLFGDQLVSNQILDTIQNEMNGVEKHAVALKIFDRYGIKAHSQVLQYLGYKVKWSGLDPENAEIFKK